ncbi:MAG: hypoxanthine phosphoribosyltransferase [Bacteriovoracaceae bacterium]|jgi:hypoxanthine phosphoribosyltransferase|nr:hypoxanthine phosphoribosyltransferase [Bacteriovoracaceae bacterium]
MNNYMPEVLLSEEEIAFRISEIASSINKEYQGQEITIICILKGAFVFCSELIRQINLPVKLEFIEAIVKSDPFTKAKAYEITLDIKDSITAQNIIVVDDIINTGSTSKFLRTYLETKSPKSIKVASLLYKYNKNITNMRPDYLGFEIEDRFVVGFGLDYIGRYRELPYIGVLNAGN